MTVEKEINEKLTAIQVGLNTLNTNMMRIVYSLIALIGATLGLKFIGSPVITVVTGYVAFFVSTYLLSSTIGLWRRLSRHLRILRLTFSTFIYFSVVVKEVIFVPGEGLAPFWFSPITDGFLILICILLLATTFRFWDNGKTGQE